VSGRRRAGGADGPRSDTVLVLDFGAQYAQLIARRIREAHVHSEIVPHDTPVDALLARRPVGIVLSGGPKSVYVPGAPDVDPALWAADVPLLGICYGAQLMARALGGEVARTGSGEYGRTPLHRRSPGRLVSALPEGGSVWMSHGDAIVTVPPGFELVAGAPEGPVSAMEDEGRARYAVQFHPEVAHTDGGQALLERFVLDVCGARPGWTPDSIVAAQTEAIRALVGDGSVLCGLSGGVDSAVAAALVQRAVGDQLTCVFVDTGLLRAGEGDEVEAAFQGLGGLRVVRVDASERFFAALAGRIDPEEKRKVVGEVFIRVFEEAAAVHAPGARFLVQGTLYPDVVESGSATAATIKSHHNVGGLPADMAFSLVEPLRDLFKDEVRAIGAALGLPEELVWRQPFPGPGLAVRVVGEVTQDRVALVRAADAIVTEEVRRAGLERAVWQAFAVLPVVRTVGVMGDERTYAHPVVVRAVESDDAMTADWARLPYELLARISSRIVNEVPGVNRVVYDVTSKPPGTIEWE